MMDWYDVKKILLHTVAWILIGPFVIIGFLGVAMIWMELFMAVGKLFG